MRSFVILGIRKQQMQGFPMLNASLNHTVAAARHRIVPCDSTTSSDSLECLSATMGFFDRFFGPPTEAKFAKLLTDTLHQAGDDRQVSYDPSQSQLVFTRDGKEAGVINLRNLFLEFGNVETANRTAWLKRICSGLVNQMDMPEDFEDVKPDLRPSVRSRSMLETLRIGAEGSSDKPTNVPWVPLSDDLIICLVYDLPNSIRFVMQKDLDIWGVSLYEAMEVARRNLDENQSTMCASLGDKLHIFQSGDAYDGTRMLMLDLIRHLKVEGNPLALPITRDCLMITGTDDMEGQRMMVELAEKQLGEARPLCSIPHVLMGDEWTPWNPTEEHPQYQKYRLLERHHHGSEYAEQKELLDKRNEKMGIDAYVVVYGAIKFEGQDCSYALWSKGVSSWLPKADLVAFFDSDTQVIKGFVPWEKAIKELRPMMQPLDYWPPRWAVEEFPTDEQLEKMGARMPQPKSD